MWSNDWVHFSFSNWQLQFEALGCDHLKAVDNLLVQQWAPSHSLWQNKVLLLVHTSLPTVMPQHNDVWKSSHSQTCFWQQWLNKLVKAQPQNNFELLFRVETSELLFKGSQFKIIDYIKRSLPWKVCKWKYIWLITLHNTRADWCVTFFTNKYILNIYWHLALSSGLHHKSITSHISSPSFTFLSPLIMMLFIIHPPTLITLKRPLQVR